MSDIDFMECDTCQAKAGQPTLCRACLHNRRLIEDAKRDHADMRKFQANYIAADHRAIALETKWNDTEALQKRLMELFPANPSPEGAQRLMDWVAIYSRLSDMQPKELVDLALAHLSDNVTSTHYEQIVEELCTRVWPNWSNEDPEPAAAQAKG